MVQAFEPLPLHEELLEAWPLQNPCHDAAWPPVPSKFMKSPP